MVKSYFRFNFKFCFIIFVERDNISEIIPDTFSQLTLLTSLGISYNQLTTIPDVITRLSELEYLNITNNRLQIVPDEIANLSNLFTQRAGEGYRLHSVFQVSQPGCLGIGQPTVSYLAIYEKT